MIYILSTADACTDYALVNILAISQTVFNTICIIVPIILIIGLVIRIVSIIANPDQKNITKTFFYQIISAIVVFFLPTIVNLIISFVPDGAFDIFSCWKKAASRNKKISLVNEISQKEDVVI